MGLDAVNETAIFYELKLGAVVTAFRTSGFGVGRGFTVWSVGEVHPLWRHFYQGPNGLINFVNSNDRNKVVDAEEELTKLVKHTFTPSIATLSGQKLCDVRMNEDLWREYADGAGGDRLSPRAKSRPERLVLDLVKLT